jgi:hypothetical protein
MWQGLAHGELSSTTPALHLQPLQHQFWKATHEVDGKSITQSATYTHWMCKGVQQTHCHHTHAENCLNQPRKPYRCQTKIPAITVNTALFTGLYRTLTHLPLGYRFPPLW